MSFLGVKIDDMFGFEPIPRNSLAHFLKKLNMPYLVRQKVQAGWPYVFWQQESGNVPLEVVG